MNERVVRRYAAFLVCLLCASAGCSQPAPNSAGTSKTIRLAFVTNNSADFWTIARRGVEKADSELADVETEFRLTSDGTAAEQQRIVDDLLTKRVAGIAISPVDPGNQVAMIDAAAKQAIVFTQDSDAPQSQRTLYIGTDNVAAGRQAGQLIRDAIPSGGNVMLFVGKLDAQNARERVQGIRDALAGSNIRILDIRTDDVDDVRAKANAADTLVRYPEVKGLVGLWSYNGPAIVNAVKDGGKTGTVKIVAFDEEADVLDGIASGVVYGTVVQQPYEFGKQAIERMAQHLRGDKQALAGGRLIVPTLSVKKDTVAAFQARLKELLGK
jgi:ribose transport system substrate-binding protein